MSLKAPDIYIKEQPGLLAPKISSAATVAAFVGYTEKGPLSTPTRVRSLMEYEKLFGRAEPTRFDVTVDTVPGETTRYALSSPARLKYYMYHSIQLYFANGGGECRVVSVGSHGDTIEADQLSAGLALLATENIDLLLSTDSVQLPSDQYYTFCGAMLTQCSATRNRFTVMDVQDTDTISDFRNGVGGSHLDYGAAYAPYLVSTLPYRYDTASVNVTIDGGKTVTLADITKDSHLHHIRALLDKQRVIMPPSSAVAGVYAQVDHQRGVWKSPANMRLEAVAGPKVKYSGEEQASLNVDAVAGKSINGIRSFSDKGTLLWGARTLDGNSKDRRYVSAARLSIKIEKDLTQIVSAVITEAHISRTWAKVKAAIESYLDQLWRRGALSGTKAADAYVVRVGLGETMTEQDLSNGDLNIKVGVAVSRPAEFITVTFTHKTIRQALVAA